jgi:hypothetical protein
LVSLSPSLAPRLPFDLLHAFSLSRPFVLAFCVCSWRLSRSFSHRSYQHRFEFALSHCSPPLSAAGKSRAFCAWPFACGLRDSR